MRFEKSSITGFSEVESPTSLSSSGLSLLGDSLGMPELKIVVENGYVTDNAETVGQYAGLMGVAEMLVRVLLSHEWVCIGDFRHLRVDQRIWVDFMVVLGDLFVLAEDSVQELRVVLDDVGFYARCIIKGSPPSCCRFRGLSAP